MSDVQTYDKPKNPLDYVAVQIGLASPQKIKEKWSHGEVKKPETINYRTFKPEKDGLFCAKIFGPIKDWECLCGKYKRARNKGVVCEKCGVEVTLRRVRRERMGHIELAEPVAHIWFLKSLPSRLGNLLDLPLKKLESVLYCEEYIITEITDPIVEEVLKIGQILNEEEFQEAQDQFPLGFVAENGGAAIRKMLMNMDIVAEAMRLRDAMRPKVVDGKPVRLSMANHKKYVKRLKVLDAFLTEELNKDGTISRDENDMPRLKVKEGHRPEWMMLEIISTWVLLW